MDKSMIVSDKPFPLKRYYILYAGIGGLVFYAMLFAFFIHAERTALHNQYIVSLVDKANVFYRDVDRDVLQEYYVSFESITHETPALKQAFRSKVEALIQTGFDFAKVRVFNRSGVVLYDYKKQANEGMLYDAVQGEGFQSALRGNTFSKLEEEPDGRRFMEVYLPANASGGAAGAVLEVYEDVTRFEAMVYNALKEALIIPTLIFLAFNVLLFVIILKADRIISLNTKVLIKVRQQMEKYISRSATEAIYSAVTEEKELFRGELQNIVIFFSDIRNFTSYAEDEKPEVVVEALNKIFELQAEIIHQHHGIIDKFVGDEIMAVFPEDKAQKAVQAGLAIQKALDAHQDVHFELGIGIHSGEALVGSIGTHERRDYTVIGNTVNTGARFCGTAAAGQLIVSDVVYQKLDATTRLSFSLSETLKLKGKQESIITYASCNNFQLAVD